MLDFVTAWFIKAAIYIQNRNTKAAFVCTNSIVQGEQNGILWGELFHKFKIKINFAHQTFKWSNEAKGNAAVHVAIIGFSYVEVKKKIIYSYEQINGEPTENAVIKINSYLVEASEVILKSINTPICKVPKMQSGSASRDGGFLIFSEEEKNELVKLYPESVVFFKRFISGDDFINSKTRWCLWLKEYSPDKFRHIKEIAKRLNEVKNFREKSTRIGTRKMADLPYLFAEERQPKNDFLLIPKVSSENRKYIPIAYLTNDFIVTDKTFIIPNTDLFHFGILTSIMHMAWVKYTCGRLESRFSYSNTIVYNNYPWPESPSPAQVAAIEAAAQKVLDVRAQYPNASLADLYDPLTMPQPLQKAHTELDKAVDTAYRPQAFATEAKRLEYLFELYEKKIEELKN